MEEKELQVGAIVRYPTAERRSQTYGELDNTIRARVISWETDISTDNLSIRVELLEIGPAFTSLQVGSIQRYSAGLFELDPTWDPISELETEFFQSLYRLTLIL